jgi:hypothetical protein
MQEAFARLLVLWYFPAPQIWQTVMAETNSLPVVQYLQSVAELCSGSIWPSSEMYKPAAHDVHSTFGSK